MNLNQKYANVSRDFIWNEYDQRVGSELIKRQESPRAVTYFSNVCEGLTDYGYWFFLSTIWVSYSGFSDLNLWKELFLSRRPKQKTSIMKPSELKEFKKLNPVVVVYRAHRLSETDWISYTINFEVVKRFARERGISTVKKYIIKKKDITALFTRRGEDEVILIDKEKALFKEELSV